MLLNVRSCVAHTCVPSAAEPLSESNDVQCTHCSVSILRTNRMTFGFACYDEHNAYDYCYARWKGAPRQNEN
eukprot:1074838-Amphidinium_carterae.1